MNPEIVGKKVMKLMEDNKISIEELANQMQLEVKELQGKLDGKEEFYLKEMIAIKNIFKLDTESCNELFFQKNERK